MPTVRLSHLFASVALVGLSCSARVAAADTHDDDDDQFRPDVIACEDAVAHLAACCVPFHGENLVCKHRRDSDTTGGCGESTTTTTTEDPVFTEDESTCIIHASCTTLVSSGVCARAALAVPYYFQATQSETDDDEPTQGTSYQTGSPTHAAVCP